MINIWLNYDTHMYTYIHIFKPTSYSSNMTKTPFYIIFLPKTELLNYYFTFIVVSHYEYGVCENDSGLCGGLVDGIRVYVCMCGS